MGENYRLMSENERLKEIRNFLGLTQRSFSEDLDIKQGSYSDVERGKAGISSLLLKNLIKRFRVNPIWLCEGKGNMFVSEELGSASQFQVNYSQKVEQKEALSSKHRSKHEPDYETSLLERQQQYLESIRNILDFIKE